MTWRDFHPTHPTQTVAPKPTRLVLNNDTSSIQDPTSLVQQVQVPTSIPGPPFERVKVN